MSSALKQLAQQLPRTQLGAQPAANSEWRLSALQGRLVELSGARQRGGLSLSLALVYAAQQREEPCVWIHLSGSSFFPPDAAQLGVDLSALPLVRCKNAVSAAESATLLAQSGGFGLIVLDLIEQPVLPIQSLARLSKLAAKERSLILCLTQKSAKQPSLGPLISLHMHSQRQALSPYRERYTLRALKDHLSAPGWSYQTVLHVPPSLSAS